MELQSQILNILFYGMISWSQYTCIKKKKFTHTFPQTVLFTQFQIYFIEKNIRILIMHINVIFNHLRKR